MKHILTIITIICLLSLASDRGNPVQQSVIDAAADSTPVQIVGHMLRFPRGWPE